MHFYIKESTNTSKVGSQKYDIFSLQELTYSLPSIIAFNFFTFHLSSLIENAINEFAPLKINIFMPTK